MQTPPAVFAQQRDELLRIAQSAAKVCYAKYSNFPVGAAVLTSSGRIYSGCNIENASFGLTNCAERTAIFKAVSEGDREILGVVVYTPTSKATPPCGACRQVLSEFGKNAGVICACDSDSVIESTVRELLPHTFEF